MYILSLNSPIKYVFPDQAAMMMPPFVLAKSVASFKERQFL